MNFGLQFFPSLEPSTKAASQYFAECLSLLDLCDRLGYTHVRTVEHYCHTYGGYSPSPLLFLSAASQRTRHARLIAGCVVPAFNNPLKLAGEIGMLDAISGGRLEVGFARAFLPHEFRALGVPLDESRARFREGLDQVRKLIELEGVTAQGRFHSFLDVTSLPRPTQAPHPPYWLAAFTTPESFAEAGRAGCGLMAIPMSATRLQELLGIYREEWRSAGHPGSGRVMLAFFMLCTEKLDEALALAGPPISEYLDLLATAATEWTTGTSSPDYAHYPQMFAALQNETFDSQREKGAAWVGTPNDIADTIADFRRRVGDFELASLQVNFRSLPLSVAVKSLELFSRHVMPRFSRGAHLRCY